MKLLRFLTLIFLSLLIIQNVYAQEDVLRPHGKPGYVYSSYPSVMFGIESGLNFNMFSQNMTWAPVLPNTPFRAFESGNGLSLFLGALIDVAIDKKSGIQFKVDFDNVYYTNSEEGYVECTDIVTELVNNTAIAEYDYNVSGTYIDFSILYRYRLSKDLMVFIGPVWRTPSGNHDVEFTVSSKTDGCYVDFANQLSAVTSKEEIEVTDQFGLDFGFGYKIPISRNMWIVPQAQFQYYFTKTAEDRLLVGYDWTQANTNFGPSNVDIKDAMLHSLKLSAALWFEL